jgi:enoyl-CoA hydratase/carnithine racemase
MIPNPTSDQWIALRAARQPHKLAELANALAEERAAFASLMRSTDAIEGIRAFAERRLHHYTGK